MVGGHNKVVLGGEAARLANTLASRSEHAARASPKGSLRLLCADGAGVLGFVHESALFHGRKGFWEEFVHGIGLFRGWRECFGVFVHESALFHGQTVEWGWVLLETFSWGEWRVGRGGGQIPGPWPEDGRRCRTGWSRTHSRPYRSERNIPRSEVRTRMAPFGLL